MRCSFIVLLLGAISVAGCCKGKSTPGTTDPAATSAAPVLAGPPTPSWKEHELSFKEIPAKGTFLIKDFAYSMSFRKFPVGTHIVVDGKDQTVNDSGTFATTVDLADKIAGLSPKDATNFRYKLDPGLKIAFKFPGGVNLEVDAPALSVWFDLKRELEKVNDHPVLFGKEAATGPAKHTILYLGVSTELFGSAATMREVDWIAVREKLPLREGKMCHGYKDVGDKGSGKERSLRMMMQDEEVAIYARHTGTLIQKKKFAASSRCPMFASGGSPTSYPSTTAVKAWLRGRAK